MAGAGFDATPAVWGSLLVACGAAGQAETALMLWRELRAADAQRGGPPPPDVFHAMMTACNMCGQVGKPPSLPCLLELACNRLHSWQCTWATSRATSPGCGCLPPAARQLDEPTRLLSA